MAERQLSQILEQLKTQSTSISYSDAASLLSKAKLYLLQLKALAPSSSTSPSVLALARETYEQGALVSIRARDPDAFTRYVSLLGAFYELPASTLPPADAAERNKVTGLYLLLLLTQGRYAEFHSELEALATREGLGGGSDVESDRFLGYPVRLERWLMEGSYDRVWNAMKKGEVPCEEYGVFSEVGFACLLCNPCLTRTRFDLADFRLTFQILTSQIRSEIASCSERAYPSLPLSSTKSLLFLDSEGAVVDFARQRGWTVKDGQIFFPATASGDGPQNGEEQQDMSKMVIENALGYARELETIV